MRQGWSHDCAALYKHSIAESSLQQYNRYINQFRFFCFDKFGCFPPPRDSIEPAIAQFLRDKCTDAERPESMLRSIQAALGHYFTAIWMYNPINAQLKNFVVALVKSQTLKPACKTKVMPIKPFIDFLRLGLIMRHWQF